VRSGKQASLWDADLSQAIAWADVESFLQRHERESTHLEYRESVDVSRRRFVDTVAAMANAGGGLILIGVREDTGSDRPAKWPTLKAGDVKPQALESSCHAHLDPYVPIEISSSRESNGEGEVVIVRVPDAWPKPIFVADRGVLVRQGQANRLASLDEIAHWLQQAEPAGAAMSNEIWQAVGSLHGFQQPLWNIACGLHRPWSPTSWGDSTDAAIAAEVNQIFHDVGTIRIGETIVDFASESDDGQDAARVIVDPKGWVLRRCVPAVRPDGAVVLALLAADVGRTWNLAQRVIPIYKPGFAGQVDLVAAFGGNHGRFIFPDVSPPPQPRPINPVESWRGGIDPVPLGLDAVEVTRRLLIRLLRAFGYSGIEAVVEEVARELDDAASMTSHLGQ
jgi:hypothetical protein